MLMNVVAQQAQQNQQAPPQDLQTPPANITVPKEEENKADEVDGTDG